MATTLLARTGTVMPEIIGYEGRYSIQMDGVVTNVRTGKVIKHVLSSGYPSVSLYSQRSKKTHFVHRLVARAFLSMPAGIDKPQIRHLDGDKLNCQLSNLVFGTQLQNQRDRLAHGTHNRGERSGKAKLTLAEVVRIKAMLAAGCKGYKIAKEFNMSGPAIYEIALGRSWGWV
ncbi:MAG: hypothetical protein EOO40_00440 [Deltaproteobacteria bacterium]|nr:MAG: hypothetical protein EOO40_00440 [Deltaproteobacteria bacterium]